MRPAARFILGTRRLCEIAMILDELGQALHFVPFLSTEMGTDTEFRVSRAKCSPPAVGGASFPTACAGTRGAVELRSFAPRTGLVGERLWKNM